MARSFSEWWNIKNSKGETNVNCGYKQKRKWDRLKCKKRFISWRVERLVNDREKRLRKENVDYIMEKGICAGTKRLAHI